MNGFRINLVCCTQVILQDLSAPKVTQKNVALTYAMAIKSGFDGADKPDWETINRAILAKWKPSGLERIKKRAWDLLEGKVQP